jgi:long-subunit acyl-CoA synthetase (AMP-forming)
MKAAMLAASNVMVVGDRRKYLVQLVSLKTVPDAATGAPTERLAADALHEGKNIGSAATTVPEAAACPLWKAYLDQGLSAGNKSAISNAQLVQKWGLLPRDLCEADGTLTPTLKLKRKQACEQHAALIDSLYAE